MKNYIKISLILCAAASFSCQKNGFLNSAYNKATGKTPKLSKNNGNDDEPADQIDSIWSSESPEQRSARNDTRPLRQILCADGLKVANAPGYEDYTNIFGYLCKDQTTSEIFENAIKTAYNGLNDPTVNILKYETNEETFVTKLNLIYGIEIPMSTPAYFADLPIYEILGAKGIKKDIDIVAETAPDKTRTMTSELKVEVTKRTPFPGGGSVEKINMDQGLAFAHGAALFDSRPTEINNYLLTESTREVTLSTEHLLNKGKNEFYEVARGILVGIKGEDGKSYLVYASELVIKNRIDPERVKTTIINLSKRTQELMREAAAEAAAVAE